MPTVHPTKYSLICSAILAALSGTPAAAQQRGSVQQAPHSMNPSTSSSSGSSTSRLQQQNLDTDLVIIDQNRRQREQRDRDQQRGGEN